MRLGDWQCHIFYELTLGRTTMQRSVHIMNLDSHRLTHFHCGEEPSLSSTRSERHFLPPASLDIDLIFHLWTHGVICQNLLAIVRIVSHTWWCCVTMTLYGSSQHGKPRILAVALWTVTIRGFQTKYLIYFSFQISKLFISQRKQK